MIILMGFKHVGKSTLGHMLAQRLGRNFIDLDDLITEKTGKTPRELHTENAEHFRTIETQVLEEFLQKNHEGILALGGGTKCSKNKNSDHTFVHVKADPETVWQRIQKSGSKLFPTREDFDRTWVEREPIYTQLADITWELGSSTPNFDESTHLTAVIGNPIGHSLSPLLHNMAYQNLNLNAQMLAFASENFEILWEFLQEIRVEILAVTAPFKQKVAPPQVANTLILKNQKWEAHNTDPVGIEAALGTLDVQNQPVVILGAGGAAHAVAEVLQKRGAHMFIVNRTLERAQEFQKKYPCTLISAEAIPPETKLIINATPNSDPAVNPPKTAHGFDLLYRPKLTPFLQKFAPERRHYGLTMLAAQGLEQIRLYTGHTLSLEDYLPALEHESAQ